MTSQNKTPPWRSRRSHARRLTVDLPAETFAALKIHVARNGTTIRAIVTELIENAIPGKENGK